jgi:uncharacterized protein YdaU (DUF1376 family)
MAELPILPLRVAELLSDTNHLTAEEFGAYTRILFSMWLQGGRLRADDAELSQIAGLSRRRWRAMRARVMRLFTTINDEISQKRLSDTLVAVREKRRKKSEAAQARWSPNTHASALHMQSKRNAIKTKTRESLPRGESECEEPVMASPELVALLGSKTRR